MANDFEKLVGEDSREDRIKRICNNLGYVSETVSEVSREIITLNQEKGFTVDELVELSEAMLKLRSSANVIKQVFSDRYKIALADELLKRREGE